MRATAWLVAGVCLVVAASLAAPAASQDEPQPAVLFDDQSTSGQIVIVDAVRLPDPGFLVIREADPATPTQGRVLGYSSLLGVGLHHTIPVPLFENVTDRSSMVATLHEDDNANNVFDGVNHTHRGHSHAGEENPDPPFRINGTPVLDAATVQPYGFEADDEPEVSTGATLLSGGVAGLLGLGLWAARRE